MTIGLYAYKGVCSSEVLCSSKMDQSFNDVCLCVCVCGGHGDGANKMPLQERTCHLAARSAVSCLPLAAAPSDPLSPQQGGAKLPSGNWWLQPPYCPALPPPIFPFMDVRPIPWSEDFS